MVSKGNDWKRFEGFFPLSFSSEDEDLGTEGILSYVAFRALVIPFFFFYLFILFELIYFSKCSIGSSGIRVVTTKPMLLCYFCLTDAVVMLHIGHLKYLYLIHFSHYE